MWNELLKALILAQTEQEKQMTYVGLAIFGFFLFVLIMDSLAKGKFIPKKGPMKITIIFMFIVVVIAIIVLTFIYK